MAETRRYLPAQHLDIRQILQEAQHRWLRPAEICEILRNYQKFNLTPEPPTRPPAGSVFLFDRKALRYFRKDGHRWRKKKDGKTVKEAHEKLKAGSVDVLHCYYAHGEDNENFQRRSYWMLDGHLEHIVLVHYREVNEGHKATITRLLTDQGPHTGSRHTDSLANSPASTIQTSCASTANRHYWSGQTISPELEDVKSLGSLGEFNQHKSVCHQTSDDASFLVNDRAEPSSHQFSWFIEGRYEVNDGAPLLAEIQTTNTDSKHEQKLFDHKFNITGVTDTSNSLTEVRLEGGGEVLDMITGTRLVPGSEVQVVATASEALAGEGNSTTPCSPMLTSSTAQAESKRNRLNNEGNGDLKKLDSFGRWMDKEIGRDCDDSLMVSDSGNYWNNLSAENDDKEVSSFSRQMQFDIDSPGPSLSQEQLFSIADFSPEWAYSEIETKVLIIGKFLQSKDISKWSCMFGEIEVSAERLTDTSIRCVAPPHAPGRVPFYVTCSNRLACSEIREFEYREMPLTLSSDPQYELQLQIRLAKLSHLGVTEQLPDCSDQKCDKCELKRIVYSTRVFPESEEVRTDKQEASILEHMCSTNTVLQSLLKDRLYRWLVYKIHEKEGNGPQVLDEEGQGVLHLAAALGYEWAVGPIVAAGVNPNFRDVSGRTALHWASYFGREETVIALLRFGADTSLVDDPKPEFPGGQTAADLASRRGHKGIAAYLAEVDLTSRLSSLTVEQNLVDCVDEVASETCSKNEEELSIKRSLAAIRKSARAAALIQAAFRARSFRQRQWTSSGNGRSEASTDLVALGSLNRVEKMSCYDDYLHSSAIRIQQKYRGWKGRNEFLKIRNRIVKVQACVRGHQVRRQYMKFVWSVSIVEKVILRWRRKRVGLRAFRVEHNTNLEDSEFDGETGDEYDFLRIGRKQKVDGVERALARVKSLVRDPKARDQYMRLATRFNNCKIVQDGESA